MEEKDKSQPEENFSDDPQENLRIENEILKLKMQWSPGLFLVAKAQAFRRKWKMIFYCMCNSLKMPGKM